MKWLNWKRSLLALLCSSFLLQAAGCLLDEKTVQTAFAQAG